MGRAEYMRQWRQKRLQEGLCIDCGNQAGEKYRYPECASKESRKEYSRGYNPEYWAANKDRINAQRRVGK